ncbi:MAG TPA: hypothetical protein VFZ80_04105 [Acidimicrobiia bacterium]
MTDNAPKPGADDDFVFALEPAQLGAVVALLIAVIVLWRVARKDRKV